MNNFFIFSFIILRNFCFGLEQNCVSASEQLLPKTVGIIEFKEGMPYWKPNPAPFETREHAGCLLGQELIRKYGIEELADAVVLACPRGGLGFAKAIIDEIRKAGGFPTLDLVICRKIPLPDNDEYGIGAVTEQGDAIYIDRLVQDSNLDLQSEIMKQTLEKTEREVQRRVEAYRQSQPLVSIKEKVVIIVDGISNGGTMIACVASARTRSEGSPRRIIVATPVASSRGKATVMDLANIPEEDFCMATLAVPPAKVLWNSDDFYQKTNSFVQMTDHDVREILQAYR